ncbi:unnamed protein product [Brassica rapa]|uniref:UspA domain-containing protein n=2 Tax=Brassica TaxID=3705 RepID=A0A8D9D134_BRACM|nr:unnamed protein product [Brassica napus]CAG7866238.1 unnamed protein product [Brassica rapa]CDY11426.1 BnaA09g39920D [Brassica napus]
MEETKERKIVVAVDESEESMEALSWSLDNLFPYGSNNTLILLYVKPPLPVYSSIDAAGFIVTGDPVAALKKYEHELVESVMARSRTVYQDFESDINIERRVGRGDAKEVICNAVQKLKADMLVIGTHDYGFFKRALLGSVSEYCAKRVKCPVIIVKKKNPQNN